MSRRRILLVVFAFGYVGLINAEALTTVIPATKLAAQAARAVSKSTAGRSTISKLTQTAGRAIQTAREWVGLNGASVVALELKPPKNHCSLPREGTQEKAIYAELSKGFGTETTVQQYSLLCNDLVRFWQGQNPHKWAMYTVSKALPEVASREGLVVELTKTEPELKLSEIADRSKKMTAGNEPSGILESTADAI